MYFQSFSENHKALKCIKKITGTTNTNDNLENKSEALFLRRPLKNKANVLAMLSGLSFSLRVT